MTVEPNGACPRDLEAPPCPLSGGPVPPLQYGQPGARFKTAEVLKSTSGPTSSAPMYGACAECGAWILCDLDGYPLRAG